MPLRKPIPTKSKDAKATSHDRNTVVEETVAQDTVQQLIAYASKILVYPIASEARLSIKR